MSRCHHLFICLCEGQSSPILCMSIIYGPHLSWRNWFLERTSLGAWRNPMRHLQVRGGLGISVSWNKPRTTVKWQSRRRRHAQEEMLTKGEVQHWWEGGGDGGGWGDRWRTAGGNGQLTACKHTKTSPNHFSLWWFSWKNKTKNPPTNYWVYFSDAQESKQCISLTPRDAPHLPFTISAIGMSYSCHIH